MAQVGRELPRRAVTVIRLFFVAVGLASMVLGYAGLDRYIHALGPNYASEARLPTDVLYFDLQLFLVQSAPLSTGGTVPWQLQIARFSAPAFALYAFTEFCTAIFAARIRRGRLRRLKGHAIVCGSDRSTLVLARRLRESGMRVVTIASGLPDHGDRYTLSADPGSAASLRAAGAARAASLYSCLDRYESNAQTGDAAERIQHEHGFPAKIHILIQDLGLCAALRARRWSSIEAAGKDVDFFNLDELAGLATVRDDTLVPGGEKPEIAIVGTGAFGRSVLLESARQWAARGGAQLEPLHVILIAEDAIEVAAELSGRYAFLDSSCHITPRAEPFDRVLAQRREDLATLPLQRLYLCQEDEGEAFKSALDTATHLQSTFAEVVVRLDRTAGLAGGFQPDRAGGALFDALGGRLRLVDVSAVGGDPDLIEDGMTEQLARACHQHYLTRSLDSGASPGSSPTLVRWEELDEEHRAANRDQAVDVGRKLSLIGCLLSPRYAGAPRFSFQAEELEYLAELEHERWSADHLRAGWTRGPRRDLEAKAHPSLVPWSELPESEREKDRDAVLAITPILADAGLTPVRSRPSEPDERLSALLPPTRPGGTGRRGGEGLCS